MKASLFTSWDTKCGIADYTCALAAALDKKGVTIEIVPVRDSKIAVHFISAGKQMNNADIAHIQHEYSFFSNSRFPFLYPLLSTWHFYLLSKQITIPKFITMHELGTWSERNPFLRFLGFLFWKAYKIILNRFDRIIVHTNRFRDILLRNGIDEDRVLFIPHPVPASKPSFKVTDEEKQTLRSSFAAEDNTILTIFGFVNSRKGYEIAIYALKELNKCTLLIAGGPQPGDTSGYAETLSNLIDELNLQDRVKILGFLPEAEVHRVMMITDIFLAPFVDSAASGSLSRIMAYQKPIVGSDIATIKELKEMGLGVELIRSGQSADLIDAVRRLQKDREAERHLIESTAEYINRFSYDRFAENLKSLYEREVRI